MIFYLNLHFFSQVANLNIRFAQLIKKGILYILAIFVYKQKIK